MASLWNMLKKVMTYAVRGMRRRGRQWKRRKNSVVELLEETGAD